MCTLTYVTAYDFLQKKIQIDTIYKYTTFSKFLCYQSKKKQIFFQFSIFQVWHLSLRCQTLSKEIPH
jgi:hypothetical protein